MVSKQILEHYYEWQDEKDEGCEYSIILNLVNPNKPENMEAILNGPKGTPYEGGEYYLSLTFPNNYPQQQPTVKFNNPILHPQVNPTNGSICFGDFKWQSTYHFGTVLESVWHMLDQPNFDSALNSEIANLFKKNPSEYYNTVKKHTEQYAKQD